MDGTRKPVVAEIIRALAHEHHVAYHETALDVLGHHITRLAGDDGAPFDETEQQVIAMQRAGYLSRRDAVRLQAEHLRQTRS